MLKLNIQSLVDKKFPNKSRFAEAMDISYQTITKLYAGDIKKINLDTIERLCIVLECTPDKLFISDNPNAYSHEKDNDINKLLNYALQLQKLSNDLTSIKKDTDSLLQEISVFIENKSDD